MGQVSRQLLYSTLRCPNERRQRRGVLTGTEDGTGGGNHDQMGPKQVTKRQVEVREGERGHRQHWRVNAATWSFSKRNSSLANERERGRGDSFSPGGWVDR